jgi:type I restriction enzyme R subunit
MPLPVLNEDTLSEEPAIEQLRRLGWKHVSGDQLDPDFKEDSERASRREVFLEGRLRRKLKEINPELTEESVSKAIRKIAHIPEESLLEANRLFHTYLISGISVDQDIGARRQKLTVYFIDFVNVYNNEFLAVNQLWISENRLQDKPDIVLFINGIPIGVIECKSPVAKDKGVADALDQLVRYQREVPKLFRTNELLIGCNLFRARYGAIGASPEQYHEWRASDGEILPNMAEHPSVREMLELGLIQKGDLSLQPPMQEVLIAGLCKKRNLLDIIQNFIVFDLDKERRTRVKKICRYQQYTAVNRIVKRVIEENDKRGIIWHWQGSGKSLIMLFAAVKLRREEAQLRNPVILIVADRVKLDAQISDTFQNCSFPNPKRAESKEELYELLSKGTGLTIMTTVQKFRERLAAPLSLAENIIVMTDEAHRTQYGNFALNLRKALPNAALFAFAGTPLDKRSRSTYRQFSPPGERYLDRYDMSQSVADGATVPVRYESRLPKLQIVGNSLDKLLKNLFPDLPPGELQALKQKYGRMDTVLSAPRRIECIARDIVAHFDQKSGPNGFKAMIIASERKTAVMYKEALDRLIDPSCSAVVITVTNQDPEEWREKYRLTPEEEDRITGKDVFQDPDHNLKFLIVCDKLLTGFDAPILQVLYLDQRLKEHTLL